MDETTTPGSPHDLLLRLAGRVDDDLLADARELVAVGEDGHALELVTAALAADRTPLPASARAELVAAARAARIDLDVDAALAPAAAETTGHRFTAQAMGDVPVIAAVRELPGRLRDGLRLRLTWRLTPAGPASGPLPHPVLLVETPEGGRSGEVLAYQIAAALTRAGVHAAVEVLTSGKAMPAYHAAALRDSAPLDDEAPTLSPRGARSSPEVLESVTAEVIEEVTADHRSAGLVAAPAPRPEAVDEPPIDLFAADEPAPRPVPMRTWPGGRRRRSYVDPAEGNDEDEQSVITIVRAPLPNPVPLARRNRPAAVPQAGDEGNGGPSTESDPDPLSSPLLDPTSQPQAASDESGWASEWASGEWTVSGPSDAGGDEDTPLSGIPTVASDVPDVPIEPVASAPAPAVEAYPAPAAPTPRSAPRPATADVDPALLKPESLARLSDADRELLARLQAELVAGRTRPAQAPSQVANGSGAHVLREHE